MNNTQRRNVITWNIHNSELRGRTGNASGIKDDLLIYRERRIRSGIKFAINKATPFFIYLARYTKRLKGIKRRIRRLLGVTNNNFFLLDGFKRAKCRFYERNESYIWLTTRRIWYKNFVEQRKFIRAALSYSGCILRRIFSSSFERNDCFKNKIHWLND